MKLGSNVLRLFESTRERKSLKYFTVNQLNNNTVTRQKMTKQNTITCHLFVACCTLLCLLAPNTIDSVQAQPQKQQQQQQQQLINAANLQHMAQLEDHAAIQHETGKISSPGQPATSWSSSRPTRHLHSYEGPKQIVDLSYPLNDQTLHWPANAGFHYELQIDGPQKDPRGNEYSLKSDGFTMSVHTGTHLDAPRHFSKDAWTVDKIPLDRLIDVPLTVVDLYAKVKANRTYSFTKDDFLDSKTKEPLVKANSVVLVYTGVSDFYAQGAKAYFGTDSKNISEMKIPGFTREAAQFLVDQKVFGVGLDAPSADSSERHSANGAYDPQAHVVFNSKNVYILENVSGKLKDLLQVQGARLTIAPLAIEQGSGSPVRLVAIVNHDSECHCPLANGTPALLANSSLASISLIIAVILSVISAQSNMQN